LDFIAGNLQDVILLPIDMNCMNATLVKRLAALVDLTALDSLRDKKDKLKSKLFMKKLELLFEFPENVLDRCVHCNELFTQNQRVWKRCKKAQGFVNVNGELKV
jgi:hypothetical protein